MDGLNARIIDKLPIKRGSQGEFFFKSVSTTSLGTTRKTIFALKIPNEKDAKEFHMWWLHFNGQTDAWLKYGEEFAKSRDEGKVIEVFPDFRASNLKDIISINVDVFEQSMCTKSSNTTSKKRKLSLVSPREVSGVGKQRFDFEGVSSPEPQPYKSIDSIDVILHDKLIFQSELKTHLLVCLRKNNISIEEFDYKIDKQHSHDRLHRKFFVRISGVPQYVCGLLWSVSDDAARSSQVSAVRLEQKQLDDITPEMTEEAIQNEVIVHCKSIPTIRICPIGMGQDLERLTFQRFCDEPVQPFTLRLSKADILPRIPVGKGTAIDIDVEEEEEDDEEGDDVLVDNCEVVMSQRYEWS